MRVTWYLSDLHACGHVRGEVVAREFNQRYPNDEMVCKTDVLLSDFYKSNVMVFQRISQPELVTKIAAARNMGIRVVYDLDDDFFSTPPEFTGPWKYYSQPAVQASIRQAMNTADFVTCSTEALARQLPGVAAPRVVIENVIDTTVWEPARASRKPTDTVTIGWMASGSHMIDAPLVLPALRAIMERHTNVRLHLIGWVGWQQLGEDFRPFADRIKSEPWIPIWDLPAAMADIDIGLAPLVDNPYNRAKSNIKWLQYGALAVPCVASRLDPYAALTDGVDGILVGYDPGGWQNTLEDLVCDHARRKAVGEAAYRTVRERYDVRAKIGAWRGVFESVLRGGGLLRIA